MHRVRNEEARCKVGVREKMSEKRLTERVYQAEEEDRRNGGRPCLRLWDEVKMELKIARAECMDREQSKVFRLCVNCGTNALTSFPRVLCVCFWLSSGYLSKEELSAYAKSQRTST